MDSIPLFVIAGQESVRNESLRAYGVQGFSLGAMVAGQTKRAYLTQTENDVAVMLVHAYETMLEGRPGPVVVEIPMDVQ